MMLNAVRCGAAAKAVQQARLFSSTAAKKAAVMPPCDFQPSPYTGPSYDEALKLRKANLSPALVTYYKKPLLIYQGHMQWLFDHENRRYLDMFGGIVTVSVGHCHPYVNKVAKEQLDKLWHTTNIYLHPNIHQYAEKLASTLPGNLKVVYFVNSGSEANDLAMMMARLYTKNFDIIALRNAYHGMSPYTMGLTNLGTWKYNMPHGFGVHHVRNPDPYRGPWGGSNCRDSPIQTDRKCSCAPGTCEAKTNFVDEVKDLVAHSTPHRLAAFFAESIQGVGGTVQFPKGYLKEVYELVRAHGGLTVADEVQTGFGRCGTHFWGFETHGVIPDIVTMAKGIGNGYPLAAVVTTPEIANSLVGKLHFNTYGGNPVASAVGKAVLEVIEKENLQQNSLEVGTYFLEKLDGLKKKHALIGDVRGKGLMIGVEMVKDQTLRTPAPVETSYVWERCKDLGVLLGKGGLYGSVLRIKPPMCINKADVDFTIACMDQALEEAKNL
eukprot:Colp12_sorted_trinity150504_noHs@31228